ncbi:MAG: type II toxin-antitoxin system HicB family antitoxin [Aestuariivita sp.]|nr:type II toxin-antitoxin system HicB family antitoxin [Aestuariivita sp.]MCY4346665.1 type II toxin-antitoxin system HicB family antitoxin [Aestuariivita sp.]
MLEYKGYLGVIDYSEDDDVLHGRLEFIRDLVTYEGTDTKSLKVAFRDAVDDYIELCEGEGRTPETPLRGSFNVHPGHDLHRRAALLAKSRNTNLNTVVSDALRIYLDRENGFQTHSS